ncbi:ATM1-type heavy metal exporter [Pandoraea terrae]|uniref:ATM1-type heavy metal exporter n=1 Tax=Pandoraea terrae TaxID=1537710 RepID=A0A5E4WKL2_9BURK|nr:ATP-binding cassette domain-containing protein [Pandoraea terrae]VVE24140.1 ATM1-type heavy metal exporter [Pandoraea terrae]
MNPAVDARPSLQLLGVASDRLDPFDCDMFAGECHAILGPSGSGKSLLLRQIADLDPGRGEVLLNGTPRSGLSAPAWRKQVRYCQPEPGWWDHRVAPHFDGLAGVPPMLERLSLRDDVLNAMVHDLSTGERQRLGLARAFLTAPRVLLLDEPTAALDEASTLRVEAEIVRLRDAGCVIVLVTHSEIQARRLAHRAWRMQAGKMEPLWP